MNKFQKLIPALFDIVLGILFIVLKGEVISIGMTVAGAVLVVLAVLSLIKKRIPACVVYAVLAALVFVAGWLFVKIALYILAAILLIHGVMQLLTLITSKRKRSIGMTILLLITPIFNVVAGICLLFNQGGTIAWVFIVTGIFLIVEGVLALFGLLDSKK